MPPTEQRTGPARRPWGRIAPWLVRAVVFALGLAALALTYRATRSAGLQFAVGGALWLAMYPLTCRLFGPAEPLPDGLAELGPLFNPPPRLLATMYAPLFIWGGIVLVAIPDFDLGPGFWGWAIGVPGAEAASLVAARSARREGWRGWSPSRPLRDCTIAALLLFVALVIGSLLQGFTLPWALLAGAIGAGFIYVLGAVLVVTGRLLCRPRARTDA